MLDSKKDVGVGPLNFQGGRSLGARAALLHTALAAYLHDHGDRATLALSADCCGLRLLFAAPTGLGRGTLPCLREIVVVFVRHSLLWLDAYPTRKEGLQFFVAS